MYDRISSKYCLRFLKILIMFLSILWHSYAFGFIGWSVSMYCLMIRSSWNTSDPWSRSQNIHQNCIMRSSGPIHVVSVSKKNSCKFAISFRYLNCKFCLISSIAHSTTHHDFNTSLIFILSITLLSFVTTYSTGIFHSSVNTTASDLR